MSFIISCFPVYGKASRGMYGKSMAHPHHCLVTQKIQSTYFNVLYYTRILLFVVKYV